MFQFKKTRFSLTCLSNVFHYFWYLLGGLWVSFGSFLESLSSLWRAGVILEGQNSPMQVKFNFSRKYSFLGFHERRFTCMGAQFSIRIELTRRYNCYFRFLKTRFPRACVFHVCFLNFGCFFGSPWVSFGILLEPLSSLWRAGVSLLGAFGLLAQQNEFSSTVWCLMPLPGQFGDNFWFYVWFNLGSLLKCVSQFF